MHIITVCLSVKLDQRNKNCILISMLETQR